MRMYGVSGKGKRVNLADGLSIWIPFGVCYTEEDDGNCGNIIKYRELPDNYCDGSFSMDDEEGETVWSIGSFDEMNGIADSFAGLEGLTPTILLQVISKQMRNEDDEEQESPVFELPGGNAITIVSSTMEHMGLSVIVNAAVLVVQTSLGFKAYVALLSVPDDEEDIGEMISVLVSIETSDARNESESEQVQELFDADDKINAFAMVKLIEWGVFPIERDSMTWDGKHHDMTSGDFNPGKAGQYEEALNEVEFWDFLSAAKALIRFVENNQKLRIPFASLTPAMRALFLEEGENITGLTWLYFCSCQQLGIEEVGEDTYRVQIGDGLKLAIPDYLSKVKEFVRTLRAYNERKGNFTLQVIESEGGKEGEEICALPKLKKPAFSGDAMDAITIAKMISTDAVDFEESDISYYGSRYKVDHVVLACDRDIPSDIGHRLVKVFAFLEENEALRIPADKTSPALRKFLGNHVTRGFTIKMGCEGEEPIPVQDMTGSMLLHMILWGKLLLEEKTPNHFIAYVSQDLARVLPEYQELIRKMIGALRAYDQVETPFTVEYRTFVDWDGKYSFSH